MAAKQDIDRLWDQKSETIRHFLEDHPSYEQLSSEVAYTLRIRLNKANIEYSAVTYRAKKLNSFLDKIVRKRSKDPFTEITDFAGVRIVHLYKNDFEKISEIINEEFKVLKKVDKSAEQDPDRFGYDAVHYIVQLGRKSSGARYDGLKSLRCEIQVRSVLQDAWAIVSHHLVYKREADIPNPLMRKINSLSAVFENADYQFDNIRIEREQYIPELEKNSTVEVEFLAQEINVDTVSILLRQLFPDRKLEEVPNHISAILKSLDGNRHKTIQDLSDVFRRSKKAFDKLSKVFIMSWTSSRVLATCLCFVDKEYRDKDLSSTFMVDLIARFDHLIEE